MNTKESKKLEVSVFHLVFIGNLICTLYNTFNRIIGKLDVNDEKIIYATIYSQILIYTNSFLEEYHDSFNSSDPEIHDLIKKIKKALKPGIKRIESWSDLYDFRSHYLVHSLRVGKRGDSIFNSGLHSYDIPQGSGDLQVICDCVLMIKTILSDTFKEKLVNYQIKLNESKVAKKNIKFPTIESVGEELEKIRSEINSNITKLKSSET